MAQPSSPILIIALLIPAAALGCSRITNTSSPAPEPIARSAADPEANSPATPPPAIQQWMDRLTVQHEYDPSTGFIVARETIALPPLIRDAPTLDAAVKAAASDRIIIAFATADRCAPCQQYKKDALNDPSVLARLAHPRFIPTHVEVDRTPQLADEYLGSRAIPMTYALREGKVIAELRGQRSAADLLEWLIDLHR
ncbi:MAG: thioredoxin family protein [Deltaproteobacteria bacterium]|nr:thioredoxin family protein [Deltaproteobacteria bacterium]